MTSTNDRCEHVCWLRCWLVDAAETRLSKRLGGEYAIINEESDTPKSFYESD